MNLTLMKAKIHRATITEADLNYEGSISVDEDLLDASGILPYEKVDVLDINNGERLVLEVAQADPVSLIRFPNVILTKGAVRKLEEVYA